MVRAILAGSKTQTRRVVKPQPPDGTEEVSSWHHPEDDERGQRFWSWSPDPERAPGFFIDGKWHQHCPYGQPGDRLWVRETWAQNWNQLSDTRMDRSYAYRADSEKRAQDNGTDLPWRPSIHMPRAASRITLEITGVRVERLQAISETDAQAEGCALECMSPTGDDSGSAIHGPGGFRALWESINGPGSWDANPWVWCVEFRRVTP